MTKKFLILALIIFAVMLYGSYSFSVNDTANMIKNVTDDTIDGAADVTNDAKNTVENAGNNVGDAVNDAMNNMENDADKMTNTADSMVNDNRYTTTRTAADLTANNSMNYTVVTWVVLAVAAVAIIGLVWYYVAQTNGRD